MNEGSWVQVNGEEPVMGTAAGREFGEGQACGKESAQESEEEPESSRER